MLEASSHKKLKLLLKRASLPWPHHLTLSRLVARSLRRKDHTWIQLGPGSSDMWWLGLLIPVCLATDSVVIVLSDQQRRRLLHRELPLLNSEGFKLGCWEGPQPPPDNQLWLLSPSGLITAYQKGYLESKQLIIPEADQISYRLRKAMAISIVPEDWEVLMRSEPSLEASLILIYARLTRRLFVQASSVDAKVRMDGSEVFALRDLLGLLRTLPHPWTDLLKIQVDAWSSWAELDHTLLQWSWHWEPLEPFKNLFTLFKNQPALFITDSGVNGLLRSELHAIDLSLDVVVTLNEPNVQEPIPLFVPSLQPLPNTEIYSSHLLDQCRRLILGLPGLTIVLLDDQQLRLQLTTELAAEFGRRVVHEQTSPESNGIICGCWDWWLHYQEQLPLPQQLIVALLPLASLESPLTAARVEAFKRQGRDWFRDLLLPEALIRIPPAVAPIRDSGGRVAILDGRLRSRSWGTQIFGALEPWTPLHRLLPN